MIKRLWITGYRSYELGIFSERDLKLRVIRWTLKNQLSYFIKRGFNWLITGAQLGTEQWSVAVAQQLKKHFPNCYQIAVMLPFQHFGQRWNSNNQIRMLRTIQAADFSRSVSNDVYHSPLQLFNYQRFMLSHTDAALLIYDPDYPGKTKYDYRKILQYSKAHQYPLHLVTMGDLQDAADEYELIYEEKHGRG